MSSKDHITVRDWRRKPPLRLRVTKKLDIHWCWIKCTRCRHMRGRDCYGPLLKRAPFGLALNDYVGGDGPA